MKKIVSIALALLLIVTIVPMAAFADSTKATDIANVSGKAAGDKITLGGVEYTLIDSADDVVAMDGNYYLLNDLELTAHLGDNFVGKFNGGGRKIVLNGAPAVFGQLVGGADCIISNITIELKNPATPLEVGDWGSPLASYATFGGTFVNIVNNANITSTKGRVGGIIGGYTASEAPLTMINCVNNGTVSTSTGFVAGVLGAVRNNKNNLTVTLQNCVNNGAVTATGTNAFYAGGVFGGVDAAKVNMVFENCANNGAVSAHGYVGGIAGGINNNGDNTATFKMVSCDNTAEIKGGESGVAGILGGFYKTPNTVGVDIQGCTNTANVSTTGNFGAAGILGYFNGSTAKIDVKIADCYNSGNVSDKSAFAGGIFGGLYGSQANVASVAITDCVNDGDVSSQENKYGTGGIFGGTSSSTAVTFNMKSCVNFGKVTAGGTFASGVFGYNNANSNVINLDGCYNTGVVASASDENATASEIININGEVTADVKNCKATGSNKLSNVELADTNGEGTLANAVDAANKTGAVDGTLYVKDGAVKVCANHDFANGVCKNCAAADPNYVAPNPPAGGDDPVTPPAGGDDPVTPPPTGDITVFVLAVAVVALAGVCVVKKKIEE